MHAFQIMMSSLIGQVTGCTRTSTCMGTEMIQKVEKPNDPLDFILDLLASRTMSKIEMDEQNRM